MFKGHATRLAEWIGILGLCLLASCAAKVRHMEVDPEFTPTAVKSRGLAILGCTSIIENQPEGVYLPNRHCLNLRLALLGEDEALRILAWDEARRTLGEELADQCLREVHDFGSLDVDFLNLLAASLEDDWRFAVVHRLESEQYKLDRHEKTEEKDGKHETVGYEYKTARIMIATFSVYDFWLRKKVFEATIEGKEETKNEVSGSSSYDIGGWLGDIVETVSALEDIFGEDEDHPYPDPPGQEAVMAVIYDKFAELLLSEKD